MGGAVPALRRSLSHGGRRLRNFTRALLTRTEKFQDSADLGSPDAAAAAVAACGGDPCGLQWAQGKAGEDRVHVVDLDILQGYQWPAFLQALAARPGGPPTLRLTGVGHPPAAVRETGRHLASLAASLRVPFEFHAAAADRLERLRPAALHRRVGVEHLDERGEALLVADFAEAPGFLGARPAASAPHPLERRGRACTAR